MDCLDVHSGGSFLVVKTHMDNFAQTGIDDTFKKIFSKAAPREFLDIVHK